MAEQRTQRRHWWNQAACRNADPDLFFPLGNTDVAAARQVCLDCPVIHDCLTHALEHHEKFGVWGGYSVPGRRHLRRYTHGRPWPTVARIAIDQLRANAASKQQTPTDDPLARVLRFSTPEHQCR